MDTTTNNANLGFLRGEIEKRIATANKNEMWYDHCEMHDACIRGRLRFAGQAEALTNLLETLDAQAPKTAESNSAQTNPKTVLAFLGWLTLAHGFVSLIRHLDNATERT